jgi:predicted Zn-ribbon and HTH transcriptional regulator
MTQGLADELRALRAKSTNAEDRDFLSVILKAEEAARAAEQLTDEMQECAHCGFTWPAPLLDGEGVCPDCLLDEISEHRRRRRTFQYLEGWML